jgi:type VI protein secretion system component Hcp
MNIIRTMLFAGAAACLATSVRAAEVDYFLKIPGMEGETRKGAYNGWIDLQAVEISKGYSIAMNEDGTGRIQFGDGVSGRRLPAGDPDRPIIIGSVPNPQAAHGQYNQTNLEFIHQRSSRANTALKNACASGRHFRKAVVHQVIEGRTSAQYVFYGLQCTARSGGARSNPKLSMSVNCVQKTDLRNGAKTAECPADAMKKDGTIVIYGKDMTLKGSKINQN